MSNGRKAKGSRPREAELGDGEQLSGKRGKTSDAKKEDSSRHGYEPAPAASPAGGAFGREEREERQDELRPESGGARAAEEPEEET